MQMRLHLKNRVRFYVLLLLVVATVSTISYLSFIKLFISVHFRIVVFILQFVHVILQSYNLLIFNLIVSDFFHS